jgi:PDZ domain-containing protein
MNGTVLVTSRHILIVLVLLAAARRAPGQNTNLSSDRRGWFGITLSSDNVIMQNGRVAFDRPPRVGSVNGGSPAEQAGLQRGDSIVSVDGLALTTPEGFERWSAVRPGVPVRLSVRRDGQDRDITIVPDNRQSASTIAEFYGERARLAQGREMQRLQSSFRSPMGWLGMGLECEECSISFGPRGSARFRSPPAVLTVDVEGPANRAGMRRGDTLLTIDGVDLTTPEGGRRFASIEPGQRVTLGVRRAGRERRVPLVAVARPDASSDELAAYQAYQRNRDSAQALYRTSVTEALTRAQVEMQDLQRMMQESAIERATMDSTRRRFATIDSALRAARMAERTALVGAYSGAYAMPPMPALAPVAPVMPKPPRGYTYSYSGPVAAVAPLRYSGRLGDLVNVEARASGAVNVNEIGENEIVVTAGDVVVRITRRGTPPTPPATPSPADAPQAAPAPAPAPTPTPRPPRPLD